MGGNHQKFCSVRFLVSCAALFPRHSQYGVFERFIRLKFVIFHPIDVVIADMHLTLIYFVTPMLSALIQLAVFNSTRADNPNDYNIPEYCDPDENVTELRLQLLEIHQERMRRIS